MDTLRICVRIAAVVVFILSAVFIVINAVDYFDPPESERFLEERAERNWTEEFTCAGSVAAVSAAAFLITSDRKARKK